MTILEALNWAEDQLKQTAEDKRARGHNQKLDAQVLLAFCLEKPTSHLFSHFEDELSPAIIEKFHRAVERRMRHEPVAYITGKKDFYKRPFLVNPYVLIPRPETEHLIDLVKQLANGESTLLEVGTGSGAIAVTLAAELSQPVIASDIDQGALAVAKHNAEQHNVDGHISFLHGNLLSPYIEKNITETGKNRHGVIVANLPYIKVNQWELLDPDVKNYEPKKALTAGVDGLDLYDDLMKQIVEHRSLFPEKLDILMEMDPSQETTLPRLAKHYFTSAQIEVFYDLANKARITAVRP